MKFEYKYESFAVVESFFKWLKERPGKELVFPEGTAFEAKKKEEIRRISPRKSVRPVPP
jgi:hypothetical protein